jgi:intracellular multiplication protein IcmV
MKKKSSSRFGGVFKRIINIRMWADWDRVKSSTSYLVYGIAKLFTPQKKEASETFDGAMKRLHISEAAMHARQNALLRLSQWMIVFAFFVLCYSGYQVFYGSIKAAIVSLVVMMIALVLAFRYHFWYFQIKKRKLGCTVEEWYRQGLMGEKK